MKNFLTVVLVLAFAFLLSSCASGQVRGERRARVDRVSAKQSSYRVRGTDQTGVLSPTQQAKLRSKTRAWRWPTNQVKVTSLFGERFGNHHDGVDLKASVGTEVRAAADGRVIYSGSKISGYGRMVVIRHAGKLSTIYAHNSKLYVANGQSVRRGQLIALSGNTGHSTGPHVHFEVREGVTAVNPLILLPSPAVANEANRRMASIESRESPRRYSQSSSRRVAARVVTDEGFRPRSPRR